MDDGAWLADLEEMYAAETWLLCLIETADETLFEGKVERWTEEADFETTGEIPLLLAGADACFEEDP